MKKIQYKKRNINNDRGLNSKSLLFEIRFGPAVNISSYLNISDIKSFGNINLTCRNITLYAIDKSSKYEVKNFDFGDKKLIKIQIYYCLNRNVPIPWHCKENYIEYAVLGPNGKYELIKKLFQKDFDRLNDNIIISFFNNYKVGNDVEAVGTLIECARRNMISVRTNSCYFQSFLIKPCVIFNKGISLLKYLLSAYRKLFGEKKISCFDIKYHLSKNNLQYYSLMIQSCGVDLSTLSYCIKFMNISEASVNIMLLTDLEAQIIIGLYEDSNPKKYFHILKLLLLRCPLMSNELLATNYYLLSGLLNVVEAYRNDSVLVEKFFNMIKQPIRIYSLIQGLSNPNEKGKISCLLNRFVNSIDLSSYYNFDLKIYANANSLFVLIFLSLIYKKIDNCRCLLSYIKVRKQIKNNIKKYFEENITKYLTTKFKSEELQEDKLIIMLKCSMKNVVVD